MKILLVTMEWPPFKGGVGNYYFNLVKNLTGQQIKVFEVGPKLFYRFFWPKWLKLFFEIRRQIKKEKPDLIWVGQVLPVGEATYLIKKFFHIPYFVSTHGLDIMLPQRSLRKEKALKQVLDNAEFITANSNFTKNELLNLGYDDNKVVVVYPCPHVSLNLKADSSKLEEIKQNLSLQGKKVLLTVGRLVKRKGQDAVIKALPELLQKFPNLVYLIVGEGPESLKLKTQSLKLGLENKVIFLANVSDEELSWYYQTADVFVMPAQNLAGDVEGFGIVYLEAASFGLPVVAASCGGVMEAVLNEQTGLLVEPSNSKDLIEKISRLLADQEFHQRLGNAAKARVEQEFIWSKQAGALNKIIQSYAK
ncbi:MAG: glycosyltransferase family 4 protein [Patescibacteria group bacterium]|jgi:phosphatidylinositol alpha-1,6-mannosyltransferase